MNFGSPNLPAIAKVIPPSRRQTSSKACCLKYHENGKRCYVAFEDSRLQVIDCLAGEPVHAGPLKCTRENLHVVEPTHHEQSVLIAGSGSNTQPIGQRFAVSYWSLHDNKMLRKFRGHSDRVHSLSMCPADDTFLSSSVDGSVRLWNVQQAGCLAQLNLPPASARGAPLAAFDSTGLVFCAAATMANGTGHYLHLYDARNYTNGAFAELQVLHSDVEKAIQSAPTSSHATRQPPPLDSTRASQLARSSEWKSLIFNQSGSQILVGTEHGVSIVLDGFEGTVQKVLLEASRKSTRKAVSCFSSDDHTLLIGNDDASISCWSLQTGIEVKRLQGHLGPVHAVACNPLYCQVASACTQTALWSWKNI